jgi:hypothetical protein
MGVSGQGDAPAALLPGKRPGTHCLGDGWAPGPVRTAAEKFATTGIRLPDRPALSESLNRLNYPRPQIWVI